MLTICSVSLHLSVFIWNNFYESLINVGNPLIHWIWLCIVQISISLCTHRGSVLRLPIVADNCVPSLTFGWTFFFLLQNTLWPTSFTQMKAIFFLLRQRFMSLSSFSPRFVSLAVVVHKLPWCLRLNSIAIGCSWIVSHVEHLNQLELVFLFSFYDRTFEYAQCSHLIDIDRPIDNNSLFGSSFVFYVHVFLRVFICVRFIWQKAIEQNVYNGESKKHRFTFKTDVPCAVQIHLRCYLLFPVT